MLELIGYAIAFILVVLVFLFFFISNIFKTFRETKVNYDFEEINLALENKVKLYCSKSVFYLIFISAMCFMVVFATSAQLFSKHGILWVSHLLLTLFGLLEFLGIILLIYQTEMIYGKIMKNKPTA